MVSELFIPKPILESIRSEGTKKAKKDIESWGLLIGEYNKKEDSISALSQHALFSQKQYYTFKDRFYNGSQNLWANIRTMYCSFLIIYKAIKIKEKKGNDFGVGAVNYQTLLNNYMWKTLCKHQPDIEDVIFTNLSYIAKTDKFEAIDTDGTHVLLSTV